MKNHALLKFAIIAMLAHSATFAAQPTPTSDISDQWPNLKEVIVVLKTHHDIGYTARVKDLIPYYRTTVVDKALALMDQTKDLPPQQRLTWTEAGWVLSKTLEDWPGQTPERRKRLEEGMKNGQFQFHAVPFTMETEVCEPEVLARGMIFSSNIARKYGLPLPISSKTTDVPSQGSAYETVLANSGVKFMHIGCNWPADYVRTPGNLFWWQGPDGSRTLMLYTSLYGSCTGLWPKAIMSPVTFSKETNLGDELLPPKGWPHKTWAAILVTGDNSGPPPLDAYKALFADAAKRIPGVNVHMGTMDEFANAIIAENPDLPVVKGEMPDSWIHGAMCDPGGMKLARDIHPQLAAAEALNTQLNLWGVPQPSIANDVALAYEKILLFGEHTWGGINATWLYGDQFNTYKIKDLADLQGSWEDHTNYIRDCVKITNNLTADNLEALSQNVIAAPPSVIVYNPLPWPRSGTVQFEGKQVPVKDVPACGYKVVPASETFRPQSASLESPFFKLALDPATGSISSLVDKRTGREWVDPTADRKLGQYLNERFTLEQTKAYASAYQNGRGMQCMGEKGDWLQPGMFKPNMISEKQVPYRAATSARGVIKTGTDSVVIQCPADPANHMPGTELRITLPSDQPYVELELTIQDKARDNWPEADWLCLPFNVAQPQFRVYRSLGCMNPATDILDSANRDLFAVGHGVTITGPDGAGVAICPIDHPLVSLDRPGCWKASKTAAEFTPKKPVVFLNLYNNQWNTNFRYWYPGTWSSRVRLWTFDAQTPADSVIATPALEARNPLVAVVATGAGSTLPDQQTGIRTSRKGTLVTAFGANPDGAGTLLRVWEQAGQSGDLTVTLPAGAKFTTATPVDLRGEKIGQPMKIKSNSLTFNLKAWAPMSFVLE